MTSEIEYPKELEAQLKTLERSDNPKIIKKLWCNNYKKYEEGRIVNKLFEHLDSNRKCFK